MLMKKLLLILLAVATLGACTSKNELAIIKNGRSNYEIRIKNQDCQQAAEQLQHYLEKASSVKLPIVMESDAAPSSPAILVYTNTGLPQAHSISIQTEGKNLLISGGDAQSTGYAVYEFLEQYVGCRWFSPSVEQVPSSSTISLALPVNLVYTPEITTRTVHSRLFYEDHAFADHQKVTTEAFPSYVPEGRVHTFHRFVPELSFYDKHPEYYALRGKKRLPTQLCLTNQEVLKIVIDSVQVWFDRYPDAQVISVSQNDNTQHCQCENCQKIDEEEGSPSGSMIRFVNAVAQAFPDKTISTLAYQYTRKPCKTKPLDNVLVTLCSIECDRSAPIEEKCSDFAEDLIGWKQLTDHIRIWDYTTQFTNFLAPFPNMNTLQPNIQFFRDNHATWIFEQHSHNPSELFELRSYVTAKLLWNPDQDVEAIINEFMQGYYEEAGPAIKKYIDLVHASLESDPDFFLYLYGDPAQAFNSFLSPELLKQYNAFFDEAEAAVGDKPAVLQRVRTARISTDYAQLEMARNGMSPDYQLLANGIISPDVQTRLNRFASSCEQAQISLMNEMGYTVDEYLSAFEQTLERAAQPNLARGAKVKLLTQPKKYADENPQVLTDGALGGSNFFANWLGFEGNDMEVVIDLGEAKSFSNISVGFLQVTNHIVFFPKSVTFSASNDNNNFRKLQTVSTQKPISKDSKRNDLEYFKASFPETQARYLKLVAKNVSKAPVWHNAAGLPVWIFADEVIVN
ncbi:F5/8 type C domain-containing protein [Sunxiuqinia elliptica]|uniref:F5/8 type C domain-containing protein n=2 Tax=Sunxiuqinia elliptica TaxID=655355 RepID=A0A1I2J083_9BACT|nr:F5/8 type C domain-containing protein [Sunxiuqinia elliptica]